MANKRRAKRGVPPTLAELTPTPPPEEIVGAGDGVMSEAPSNAPETAEETAEEPSDGAQE